MLQQILIPKTPDENAASLSKMSKEDQCIVKGVIIGLKARWKDSASPSQGTARPRA